MVVFLRRMGIFPEVTNHSIPPPADSGGPECSTSPRWSPREPFPAMSGLGTKKGEVRLSLVVKSEEPEQRSP